jgi:hypothetical protein
MGHMDSINMLNLIPIFENKVNKLMDFWLHIDINLQVDFQFNMYYNLISTNKQIMFNHLSIQHNQILLSFILIHN